MRESIATDGTFDLRALPDYRQREFRYDLFGPWKETSDPFATPLWKNGVRLQHLQSLLRLFRTDDRSAAFLQPRHLVTPNTLAGSMYVQAPNVSVAASMQRSGRRLPERDPSHAT
jgi:hypothetical protein